MNVCVVGWYGTETLGDRSILLGITSIFSKLHHDCENIINIGSLYPFFTKRTLYEDMDFYKEIASNCSVNYFDVMDNHELKRSILDADYVIMGGGPLMDLEELMYIQKIFEYAKKKDKKTIVFGCGVGPVTLREFKKCIYKIIKNADLCIFRDSISKSKAIEICKMFTKNDYANKMYVNFDPAFIPPLWYKERYATDEKEKNNIVINLRDYSFTVSSGQKIQIQKSIDSIINDFLKNNLKVILLPNHNFFHGGDDRKYFSDIYLRSPHDNLKVVYKPQSLKETFNMIMRANYCVGMRYHAILFHTVLNGNNYILDYTEPEKGKISGFFKMINSWDFYENRYSNIFSSCPDTIKLYNSKYDILLSSTQIIDSYIDVLLKNLIKRYEK